MPTSDELREQLEDEDLEPRKRHLLTFALRMQEDADAAFEEAENEAEHERQQVERAGATEISVDQDPEPLKVEIGDDESVEDKTPEQQASKEKGLPAEEKVSEEEQEAVEAEVEAGPEVSPVEAAIAAEEDREPEVPEQDENVEAEDEDDPDAASKKLDKE